MRETGTRAFGSTIVILCLLGPGSDWPWILHYGDLIWLLNAPHTIVTETLSNERTRGTHYPLPSPEKNAFAFYISQPQTTQVSRNDAKNNSDDARTIIYLYIRFARVL